jgi:hypothetical protein
MNNMSTKHTPGPWSDRNGRIFQTDREELTIANVGRAFDGDYSPANARLIAAAPDLLEALQLAVRQNSHDMLMTGEELRKCEAAIAKATGATN